MVRLLERVTIWLIERKYLVHVRKSGQYWKVDLPERTIKARTLAKLEDILEELEDDD